MFVRQSTYNKALSDFGDAVDMARVYKRKYEKLLGEWNALVRKVNAIGGESALIGEKKNETFSDDDIKKILMLIHPDKHGGKQMAVDMTAKVLSMRGGK